MPEFPEDSIPTEILVVQILTKGLYLLNFQQQTQRLISGSGLEAGTSPDGKWLAYVSSTDNGAELIVESPNGERKIQSPFDYQKWFIFDNPWLGNEQISYLIWYGNAGYDLRTVVFNPFTGQKQELLPDYPNFNNNYYGPSGSPPLFFKYSNVVYDPSLRFVVYPKKSDYGLYAALWDRETNQEIAKVFTWGWFLPPPLWYPDSHAFVVTGLSNKESAREWFMVDIDGEIHQLTQLGDQYANYEFGDFASLSPDGHYLAFGLFRESDPSPDVSPDLIILDLTTLKAFNTCITISDTPLWSPDSQYLVVEHPDPNPNSHSIVVLNVDAGWAASVLSNDNENEYRYPVGWLDSGE